MSNAPIDLGLTDKNSGGGCACCSPAAQTAASVPAAGSIETSLAVTGMTCGHCVSSVTEELSELDGVESVDVQLNVGGASTVVIASSAPLDVDAVRNAIDEAGYALADS